LGKRHLCGIAEAVYRRRKSKTYEQAEHDEGNEQQKRKINERKKFTKT
jgi:hypothetical protein